LMAVTDVAELVREARLGDMAAFDEICARFEKAEFLTANRCKVRGNAHR